MSQTRHDRTTSREIDSDDTLVLGALLRNIGASCS